MITIWKRLKPSRDEFANCQRQAILNAAGVSTEVLAWLESQPTAQSYVESLMDLVDIKVDQIMDVSSSHFKEKSDGTSELAIH